MNGNLQDNQSESSESCSVVSNSLPPHGLYSPWNSPGQKTGVSRLFHLQRIFPTQESNPGLPHCRWILYQLNHKGSPRILESGHPIPSPTELPDPGIKPGSPALHVFSLPTELSGKPNSHKLISKRILGDMWNHSQIQIKHITILGA